MRSVIIISENDDLEELAPALEQSGFSVTAAAPVDACDLHALPRADAAIVDLRGLDGNQRQALSEILDRDMLLALAVVDERSLDLISIEGPYEDFAVMPASNPEVVRRLERAIWRKHGVDNENRVTCGALTIDLSNYRVTVDGEVVVLTFKEYELLRFLALNEGRVFTREQLLSRVWGYDYFGGARTVDVHIRRIRSKIEVRGHTFIETVRNVGYRLVSSPRSRPAEKGGPEAAKPPER